MTVAKTFAAGSAAVRRVYSGPLRVVGTAKPYDTPIDALGISVVLVAADSMSWTASRCGPIAVYDPAVDRTWVAFMKSGGDLYCTYYDHADGTVATPVLVMAYPFASNDFHHAIGVALDNDGRVHIIWGGHNDSETRHYRMVNVRDPSAWTEQVLADGTYVYVATADDGELLFTDRAGVTHGTTFPAHEYGALNRSTDGQSWIRSACVNTVGTPESVSDFYQTDALWHDGRLHILWSVARGTTHDETHVNLYYASFDQETDIWYAADGTDLGASINWTDHASCLVATVSNDAILASLTFHDGGPVVAYWASPTGTTDLTVCVWDGSAWSSTALVSSSATIARGPRIVSSGDKLILFAPSATATYAERTVDVWRLHEGRWRDLGTLLEPGIDGSSYHGLMPIHGGPAVMAAQRFVGGTYGDNNPTRTGPLHLALIGA